MHCHGTNEQLPPAEKDLENSKTADPEVNAMWISITAKINSHWDYYNSH